MEFKLQKSFENTNISLQWKGTKVCMDFNCQCGHHSHIDEYFCYYVRCPGCQAVYKLNSTIEAIPIPKSEEKDLPMKPICETDIIAQQKFMNAVRNGAKVSTSVKRDENNPTVINIEMTADQSLQQTPTINEVENAKK